MLCVQFENSNFVTNALQRMRGHRMSARARQYGSLSPYIAFSYQQLIHLQLIATTVRLWCPRIGYDTLSRCRCNPCLTELLSKICLTVVFTKPPSSAFEWLMTHKGVQLTRLIFVPTLAKASCDLLHGSAPMNTNKTVSPICDNMPTTFQHNPRSVARMVYDCVFEIAT